MPDAKLAKPARWPLLGSLSWLAAAGSLGIALIAALWRDTLSPCSNAWLALHYIAFMCQTFAYHAGIAMAPVILIALLTRRRRLLIAATIGLLAGIAPEVPRLLPHSHAQHPGEALKLMSVNLMYGRGDARALLSQIDREAPNVIVFQEWTPSGAGSLRGPLSATFPFSLEQARDDAFGQAVFSRRAFTTAPKPYPPLPGFSEPQISFAVPVDGKPMRIVDVHLLPPVGLSFLREQRRTAANLASWIADTTRDDRPDVLAGDFNAPPRTGIVRAFTRMGLQDAHTEAGFWRGSTWPRTDFLSLFPGLQLDHVLHRPSVECMEARTGDECGSDHRPVIVRLRWRSPATSAAQ